MPALAPYGTWKSPITSDLIVAGSIRLGEVRLDGTDIYWSEGRPVEGGRTVLVRWSAGQETDVILPPLNVRTRVHEYGGGAYQVAAGQIYFSNFADQCLYRQAAQVPDQSPDQSPDQVPTALTPEGYRYADAVVDQARNLLICVREDHSLDPHQPVPSVLPEPVNTIVAIDLAAIDLAAPNTGKILVSGQDFYAAPRLSPDGQWLCWLSWNHPNMPWDGTELWVAALNAEGKLGEAQKIAGGLSESVFQPEWSPDGSLYFISDRTNWWNLYRWQPQALEQAEVQAEVQNAAQNAAQIEALCPKAAEFGLPLWVFDMTTYGFESAQSLICTYVEAGVQHLARLNTVTLELSEIATPFSSISGLKVVANHAVFVGGTTTSPSALVRLDLQTGAIETLRRSSSLEIDPGYISAPAAIEFPTADGLTAHGYYYAPQNRDYSAPAGERPPLLVKSHGGPTAATSASFNPSIQYWTSRGIAILDVNYGGSTGYGRDYRERLKGCWGIVDVDDCVNGANYLVAEGLADPERLCIDGGSAGGYTTLAALTFRDTFKAGASYYGVSDLEALARDTHKFESRYLDGLIGKYPEQREIYQQRSPISAASQLDCPLIFFQGDEDKIVPPNQAEMMVEILRQKGLPVAYLLFAGEQHGFRKAENIRRALDGELYFYARVFGFELAEAVEPVVIENLP